LLHLTLFDGCADAGEIGQIAGLSGTIIGFHLKGQNLDPAVPPPRTFVALFTSDFIIFGETKPARASLAAGAAAKKSAEKGPLLKRIR
jgi:hypothetical protein